MKRINKRFEKTNQVALEPSRILGYKIMEYEGSSYLLDMLPHWYSIFFGLLLNLMPARFYKVKDASRLYYQTSWKERGGGMGIIIGVTAFSSTSFRIIYERVGNQEMVMWIRFLLVFTPFSIMFCWHEWQRGKKKKEVSIICQNKIDIVPDGFNGYVKGRLKKPYIKNFILFLFMVLIFQCTWIFLATYFLFSSSINLATYFLYLVLLMCYYYMVPRLALEVCINDLYIKKV